MKRQQYVPALLPGVAANTVQVTAPKKGLDDVWVQVVQNLAGGAGVAGLVALGAWRLAGGDWQATAVAGLVAGFAVFCLALAIRSFAD
jgi:predicted cobalt transporter CbtA